jgi:hypothetical protein
MPSMRQLLPWWAISWALAGLALAYEDTVFDHSIWITHTPIWPVSYLPSAYQNPVLTAFLSLFGSWWSYEAPYSAQPILLFCLLFTVWLKRRRAKRQPPVPDDLADQS